MRLLVDATPLLIRSAGVKTYTYHWIDHLRRQSGNDRIITFPAIKTLGPLEHENSIVGGMATVGALGLEFLANRLPGIPLLDWALSRADVVHASNLMRNPPRNSRHTATLHDLTTRLMPELHTPANIAADESFTNRVLRRAAGIIAVSENTKADAVRMLGLDPGRIEVIYSGVSDDYFHAKPSAAARPYVLFLGTIEPRKNIDVLLDAWQASRLANDFDLVIAGAKGWASDKTIARLTSGLKSVRYRGYVPEGELPGLTAGAKAFVYPSLYEGFGFPVAQAMAAGVPVITANTSCLPEVAGEGALLVDPRSQDEIKASLEKLLLSATLQAQLGAAGRDRANLLYRWEICARRSWEFFRRLP